jgi:hypothetical protein
MARHPVFRAAPRAQSIKAQPTVGKRCREHVRWPSALLSMKARTTIAVILEQLGKMLSAHQHAMAPPRLAGSVKIKIDGWFGVPSTTNTRHCFDTSSAW